MVTLIMVSLSSCKTVAPNHKLEYRLTYEDVYTHDMLIKYADDQGYLFNASWAIDTGLKDHKYNYSLFVPDADEKEVIEFLDALEFVNIQIVDHK